MDSIELLKYLGWIIPSGFVFIILKNVWLKHFSIRPKIVISIEGGAIDSNIDTYSNKYNYTWQCYLVLYNDSVYQARKVSILKFLEQDKIKISNQRFPIKLEPDEKVKLEFSIHHSVSVENFQKNIKQEITNQRKELTLRYLDELNLVIVYESIKAKKFYTSFSVNNRGILSKIHFLKFNALRH
jgi:hypothetical protein